MNVKILMAVGALALAAVSQAEQTAACAVKTDAQKVLDKLLAVQASPNVYWSWANPYHSKWPPKGDPRHAELVDGVYRPKPLDKVVLDADVLKYSAGKRSLVTYSDLASVAGTWHPDEYYAANRASLTAMIKKQWKEYGAVIVFSWHLDHPYCTNGYNQAAYRYKSSGADRNVIGNILSGKGSPCGTDTCLKKNARAPYPNPRVCYFKQLDDIAAFYNGLVDDETGRKIPVIMRHAHEMDGAWFWWGRTWCTADEFRRFTRMTTDYLRQKCDPKQLIFAYTPDRTWKDFGKEGDSENTFMAYYPGDKYVDLIGIDDYSIGQGPDKEVDERINETVRKLRLLTAFAKPRRQVVAITECGGVKKRDDFWKCVDRIVTAPGVEVAFVDTWGGRYGTIPDTPAAAKDLLDYVNKPTTLMAGPGNGFRD